MRTLSKRELELITGGSVTGRWGGGGSGGPRWRLLNGTGAPGDPEIIRVYGNRQDTGIFDDEGQWQDHCEGAFEWIGETVGALAGRAGGGAAAGVEIAIGVVATPATGGFSLSITVTGLATGGAQIAGGALLGGFLGNQAGILAGNLAC